MKVTVTQDDFNDTGTVIISFDNRKTVEIAYETVRKEGNNYFRYWETVGPVDGEIEYAAKEVEG